MCYENDDILLHYGTPRHSGRYPWGSGDDPYQHGSSYFLKMAKELKDSGLSETQIAEAMGYSTTEYRAKKSLARTAKRDEDTRTATELKGQGLSNVEIGKRMEINESSVRSLLNPQLKENNDKTQNVANMLMRQVDEKGYIDVGTGVEREIGTGISSTRFNTALAMAESKGYSLQTIKVEQATMPGQMTTVKVLAPPGTQWKDIINNKDKIRTITEYMTDDGATSFGIQFPNSIDGKRVKIRYAEEGGTDMDGVIQLRRGVEDISLGNSSYAQVRIAVDGKYYMKGMAIYSDDMPKGVDVIYNSNKKSDVPPEKVYKEMKTNPDGTINQDNPFGAVIKPGGQRFYNDPNGEYVNYEGQLKKISTLPKDADISGLQRQSLSVVNKLKEEGDWNEYSKNLASQMLSKQSQKLINNQLELSYADKKAEYDEICSLTNPAIKKKLLESFANDCDASAVSLKAAALPRQATKVILPVPTLKDTEIYAPSYKDGEKVALIRYPHGGTFEIPVLTVNNKHKDAKSLLENAIDAVGINSKVAERLSGADFDGDTAVVIPCNSPGNKVKITSTPALEGLKGFDTKSYKFTEEQLAAGAKVISNARKQAEMGKVSNLITDMTLKGAKEDELARAVRHSMVVIDSEKHKLDYEKSYVDNNIAELREKYQGGANRGASTLISQAKSPIYVNQRKDINPNVDWDKETGKIIYKETGSSYTKDGKTIYRTDKSTKMAEADDARKLSSGTPQEEAYAQYANRLKALANSARKEYLSTQPTPYSPAAKKAYQGEVDSLNAKLNIALKNAPRERQAQLIASCKVSALKKDNPDMTTGELKKAAQQALAGARVKLGASKTRVDITDREWSAIQAGAISTNKLTQILNNTDMDKIKERATPRTTTTVNAAKKSRMKAMSNAGYTLAEIAEAMGCSSSTVSKAIKS